MWTVAKNIADRLRDLREALGGLEWQEMARRAGVRPHQLTAWTRGRQRPPRSRLEFWAGREGWPVEIFAEGAAMPSAVVNRLAAARSGPEGATVGPRPHGSLTASSQVQRRVTDALDDRSAADLRLMLRGAIMGGARADRLLELLDALDRALERERKPEV